MAPSRPPLTPSVTGRKRLAVTPSTSSSDSFTFISLKERAYMARNHSACASASMSSTLRCVCLRVRAGGWHESDVRKAARAVVELERAAQQARIRGHSWPRFRGESGAPFAAETMISGARVGI